MRHSLNRAGDATAFLNHRKWNKLFALLVPIFLVSCENAVSPIDDPDTPEMTSDNLVQPKGSIFGSDGLDITGLFGPGGSKGSQGGGGHRCKQLPLARVVGYFSLHAAILC